jgi:hypothetical protein
MLGLDYSAGYPRASAISAAGYGFVVRYLDNGYPGRANLTAAELSDMRAHGVAVAVVWESAANRAAEGRDAGVADARAADVAVSAAGAAGWPVYFAVDYDIPDAAPGSTDPRAKLGAVADYFSGVVSVLGLGRTGVYGGFWAVKRLLDAGLASWAWQTAAWSGGNTDPRIHLYQRIGAVSVDGISCDVNEARQADFGQQGDDMTPDDILNAPIQREGTGTGTTTIRAVAAWSDSNIDAINRNVDGVSAKVDEVAAAVKALSTPTIDYDTLAAKVAAHIRLSGTVVVEGDQPTGS